MRIRYNQKTRKKYRIQSILWALLIANLCTFQSATASDCNISNPCDNGGQCIDNICLCLTGYSGSTCQLVEPEVKCLSNRIEIHIQKPWAEHYIKTTSPEQLYMGNKQHAEKKACQARPHPLNQNTYVLTVDGLSSCGTEVSRDNATHDYIYTNSVYSNRFSNTIPRLGKENVLITRIPRLTNVIEWTCLYQHKYQVSTGADGAVPVTDEIVPVATFPRSSAEISIDTFEKPFWNDKYRMDRMTFKQILDDSVLYFRLKATMGIDFNVNTCAITTLPGSREKNIGNPNYKEKLLISDGCVVQQTDVFGTASLIRTRDDDFGFGVGIKRRDWIKHGDTDEFDPTIYIHCSISQDIDDEIFNEDELEDFDGCAKRRRKRSIDNVEDTLEDIASINLEIDAGPFQIQARGEVDENALLAEYDQEHTIDFEEYGYYTSIDPVPPPDPPIDEILELLNSLENDAGETRDGAWDKLLEIIDSHQYNQQKSMVQLKSAFQITADQNQTPINFNEPLPPHLERVPVAKSKLKGMVILAICVGTVFIGLIFTPIVLTCYRNYHADTAKGRKTDYTRKPVEQGKQMEKDNELESVDHTLTFVEYTDIAHENVFDTNPGGWVKSISADRESIDISEWKTGQIGNMEIKTPVIFHKQVDMTYSEQKRELPSYVVIQNVAPSEQVHRNTGPCIANGRHPNYLGIGQCIREQQGSIPYKLKQAPGVVYTNGLPDYKRINHV